MSASPSFVLHFADATAPQRQRAALQQLSQSSADSRLERVRLHAIAAAASVVTSPDAAREHARLAGVEAAQTDDERARAWALIAACIVDLSCAATVERLEMSREVLRICSLTGEHAPVATAYFVHLASLAELGRITELDLALSSSGEFVTAFPHLAECRQAAWFRCLRATLDGQADVAENLAEQAFAIATADGDPDAEPAYIGQLAIVRWLQGRVVELEPAFLNARRAAPHEPVWAVSLAWMWLRQGRKSAARALVNSLPQVTALPIDRNWLATACILAAVAAELDQRELATAVYETLLPYEDRLVTIGLGITCWGTVARSLALLARTRGDVDLAIGHYRRAISRAAEIGAHPWLAEAQWELAAILADRGHAGDHGEATELAAEAAAAGRALQLDGIEGAATKVLAGLQPTPAEPLPSPVTVAQDSGRPRISVLGDFVVISASGTQVRWQSRKARQLLRALVARRGAAVTRESLMHMLWPDEAPHQVANRFSVAATTVRRALDPTSSLPSDAFLETSGGRVRLRSDRLDIDVEEFLTAADAALASDAPAGIRMGQLSAALAAYGGEPLLDDGDELWLDELRREAHLAYFAVAHALAESAADVGDHLTRVEAFNGILAIDVYDQRAHDGLVDALTALGAHGRANAAAEQRRLRMSELGLD